LNRARETPVFAGCVFGKRRNHFAVFLRASSARLL
jgi:hypothetical protein